MLFMTHRHCHCAHPHICIRAMEAEYESWAFRRVGGLPLVDTMAKRMLEGEALFSEPVFLAFDPHSAHAEMLHLCG